MEKSTPEKCPPNFQAISLILHIFIKNGMCTNEESFLKKISNIRQNLKKVGLNKATLHSQVIVLHFDLKVFNWSTIQLC